MSRGRRFYAVLVVVVAIASFTVGYVIANRVGVEWLQPIAGNRMIVPNPGLVVANVTWVISANASLVIGLNLWVLAGPPAAQYPSFTIYIQVSCLNLGAGGREINDSEYICSTGQATIPNPGNGTFVRIPLHPAINPETSEIHDLSFIVTASRQPVPNRPPVVGVICRPTTARLNETVHCDASASYDPEGGPLTCEWNWGDGTPVATGVVADHHYTSAGTYVVSVTCRDAQGASASASVVIVVTGS